MSIKTYTTGKKMKPENESQQCLRAHILSGGSPKEFAIDRNLAPASASKMLAGMGIKKVYVTDEEYVLLKANRKVSK
jgi:hypothetical protein